MHSTMSTSGGRCHVDGAHWTPATEIIFIDLIYEEFIKGNFQGSTFSSNVWKELTNNLNNLASKCYSPRLCREKLFRIKLHWGKFRHLMLEDPGLGWDSERELPDASDLWWSIWEEAHPKDIGLRKKPCRRYEKLCEIFSNNHATGNRARSSAQVPPLPDNAANDYDADDLGLESPTPSQVVDTSSQAYTSKRRKQNKHALEKLVDSFEKSSNSFNKRLNEAAKEKQSRKETVKKCMDAVRALPGVTAEMVVAAVHYFHAIDNRELFLELNQHEQKLLIEKLPR